MRDLTVFQAITGSVQKSNSALSPVNEVGGWNAWWIGRPATDFQQDVYRNPDRVLACSTVYACITLIASDIGKMRIKLTEQMGDIWQETTSPAFSPVLRKPNAYQTHIQFKEWWIISKLVHGNTYVFKQRDNRGIVTGLQILDPWRVMPLVAEDGSVFYRLGEDRLTQQFDASIVVPASEVIHDRMNCLFHPLFGLSPLFASGLAASQALHIQRDSERFFKNSAKPSGILTAPGSISNETAARLQENWLTNHTGENAGKIAVAGDGLTFTPMQMSAVDAQLIEQLKWTADNVCSTFHVPAYMVGVGPAPLNNNVEALAQQYYSQCLQIHIESMEACLDEGLAVPNNYGTELDLDCLLRMDTATQITALNTAVSGGWMAPNEARARRDLPPVKGGQTPYLQQQNYSLSALDARDSNDPFKPPPTPPAIPAPTDTPPEPDSTPKAQARLWRRSPESLINV